MKKRYLTLLQLHLCFFKSTAGVTLACQSTFLLFYLAFLGLSDILETSASLPFFLPIPFGLILDILYKEAAQQETYYFYYNQGIRKVELWIVSFLAWSVVLLFTLSILELCMNAWK